jgi:hypothetical protein
MKPVDHMPARGPAPPRSMQQAFNAWLRPSRFSGRRGECLAMCLRTGSPALNRAILTMPAVARSSSGYRRWPVDAPQGPSAGIWSCRSLYLGTQSCSVFISFDPGPRFHGCFSSLSRSGCLVAHPEMGPDRITQARRLDARSVPMRGLHRRWIWGRWGGTGKANGVDGSRLVSGRTMQKQASVR